MRMQRCSSCCCLHCPRSRWYESNSAGDYLSRVPSSPCFLGGREQLHGAAACTVVGCGVCVVLWGFVTSALCDLFQESPPSFYCGSHQAAPLFSRRTGGAGSALPSPRYSRCLGLRPSEVPDWVASPISLFSRCFSPDVFQDVLRSFRERRR